MTTTAAGASPVECHVRPLVERLQDEADLCRNEGADDVAALLDEAAAALSYYRAGLLQERPEYVPKTVLLTRGACGDGPFRSTRASAGQYAAECNRWGAVSVRATNGQMLGLRPAEFEVTSWTRNAG